MRFYCVLLTLSWLISTQFVVAQTRVQKKQFAQAALAPIGPNDFKGSDTHRIQAAVNAAKGTTNSITIPQRNANGTTIWKIDQAILLPSEMTVILENCVIQLSDSCRDNILIDTPECKYTLAICCGNPAGSFNLHCSSVHRLAVFIQHTTPNINCLKSGS